MISIKDFLESIDYKITDGWTYSWQCYGYNAYGIDSWSGTYDSGYSASIVFDTKTQDVYEVSVCDFSNNRAYRLFNPDYRLAYKDEMASRGIDTDSAWDDVQYIELETDKDMLEKIKAILKGEKYDERVEIPIDLDKDELLNLFKAAHAKDMTLNDYINHVLVDYIDIKKANDA